MSEREACPWGYKGADAYRRAVDQFWHNYLSILEKSSIPAKSRLWYRKHIEAYIANYQSVKLQQHLPAHVDKYLTTKGRNTQLPEWQLLICPDWASDYDWYQWHAFSRGLESDHPTLLRKALPPTNARVPNADCLRYYPGQKSVPYSKACRGSPG